MSATNNLYQRLVQLVQSETPEPGLHETGIKDLMLGRADAPETIGPCVYNPTLGFIVQGSKNVQFGDRELIYGPLTYFACNVQLPAYGQILEASKEKPFLSFGIKIDPQEITDLVLESKIQADSESRESPEVGCGMCMTEMDEGLQTAVIRLLSLLKTPADIPVLAPLARREIIYRALHGSLGSSIRKFAVKDSQSHRVSRVINTLNRSYNEPLRIAELAEEVNMSESSLFHTFKKITRMSPLQFQKKLRLHEARRLMLSEGLDAASAGYRVGYQSPSQFSREYSRLFGSPPREDVSKLRGTHVRSTAQMAVDTL